MPHKCIKKNRILKTALLRIVVLQENEHFHLITQARAGLDHSRRFDLHYDLKKISSIALTKKPIGLHMT